MRSKRAGSRPKARPDTSSIAEPTVTATDEVMAASNAQRALNPDMPRVAWLRTQLQKLEAKRTERLVKAVQLTLIAIVFITFVLQNAEPVDVNLLVFSLNIRLIWVIFGCGVLGGVAGYLIGRPDKSLRALLPQKETKQKETEPAPARRRAAGANSSGSGGRFGRPLAGQHQAEPEPRVLQALLRHLVGHRILPVDDRHAPAASRAAAVRPYSTRISGSTMPCWMRTGGAPAKSYSNPSRSGRKPLMPSSPAGRGRSLRRSPRASVRAQPWEKPATMACDRSKPYSAQDESRRSSRASTDDISSGPPLGIPSVPYHCQPRMNGMRRPGQHGEEPALGVEVGDERLEVVLVGALAVDEQQQPVGLLSAPHHVGDQWRGHAAHPTAQ